MVIGSDIVDKTGEETVERIKATSSEALFVRADVSKAAKGEALIGKVVEVCARLDCAFNNAGIEGGTGTDC